MAIYNPPNFTEYISTFNPVNWEKSQNSIDTAYLNAHYLKYPVAQGTETLINTNIEGYISLGEGSSIIPNSINPNRGLTIQQPDNYRIKFEGANSSVPLIINDNESLGQNSIFSVVLGNNTCANFVDDANSRLYESVVIGNDALISDIDYEGNVQKTVAVGKSVLSNIQKGLSDNNTSVGYSSLSELQNGNSNTSYGFQTGLEDLDLANSSNLLEGSKNTLIGANATVSTATSGICNHSTALGADSLITTDNQIQLGTIDDYVNIPNYIKYPDGSIQNSSNNFPTINKVFNTTPQSIALSELQSFYIVAFTTGASSTLNLPTTGLTDKSVITVFNNNYTQITNANLPINLNTGLAGRLFTGRFASNLRVLVLRVGNWVKVAWNTTSSSWDVIDKSFVNTIDATANNNLDYTDTSLVNTLFRLGNSNGNYNLYYSDLTYRANNANGYYYIDNSTDYEQTLNIVSSSSFTPSTTFTFTGLYGSGANTITIPPKTQYSIFIGLLLSGSFSVQQRSPSILSYVVAYSGTDITTYANSQYFDTNISLTGSVATTFFLPDPRSSVNPYSKGRSIVLANDGSGLITVNSTNGAIGGTHGNGVTTIYLPDSTQYTFYCNGTTWEINERSADITYQNLNVVLASVNYATNYNYLSATLNISSTTGGTLAYYPSPSATFSHLTTSIVRNVGIYDINIQVTGGGFKGLYGNSNSFILIPAGAWMKLFSDGVDWLVIERSIENQKRQVSGAGATRDLSLFASYLNCDFFLTPDINNRIFIIVNPTVYPNQGYKIYNSSSANSLSLQTPSGTFLGDARYSGYIGDTLADIPPNSWLSLYSDGTNWKVYDKSATNQVFNISFNSSRVIDRNFYLNSVLNLTSTGGVLNYTIYNPNANYVDGCYLQIFNKGSLQINLVTPSGVFAGAYGSNTTTLVLPVGCWVKVVSDGTNWICDETNPNRIFDAITIGSTPTNYTSAYNYLNAYVPLNPTISNPTVQLVIPSSIYAQNKYYNIENVSIDNYLTLSIASGVFSGAYGSETTTLIIPQNSAITMYSNGTNWNCNTISNYGWHYYDIVDSPTLLPQYIRQYNSNVDNGYTIVLANIISATTYRKVGLEIIFRHNNGRASDTYQYYVSANGASGTTGTLAFYSISNNNANYPFTGAMYIPYNISTQIVRLQCFQSGKAGSGLATITSGNPLLTVTTFTSGALCYNSIITLGGVDYTVRGMNSLSASGTITGTAGSSSAVLNCNGIPTVGMTIQVAGLNYTVLSLGSDPVSWNAGLINHNITISPVVPVGSWASVAVVNPNTAKGRTGIYSVSPVPAVNLTTTAFTCNNVYSWGISN